MRRNLCFTCKGKRTKANKHAEGAWKCDQLNRAEGSRGDPPCRVKGRRPLWGLGQRPNCFTGDQSQGSRQQRRRQRSVPASNSARPQTRPQLALFLNSTVSRQMGATDQHREQFVSRCWSFLMQGKARWHKKSTPADARVDKFDNLWIILLPAGRHRHHRRGLLPAGQGRPRPHPEARRGLLRAQSASRACPQKSPDE